MKAGDPLPRLGSYACIVTNTVERGLGGDGWRQHSSLPSVCPSSLPRDNSARGASALPKVHRIFVVSIDFHKQISLIFHALFVQCARAAQPRWNALQKAERKNPSYSRHHSTFIGPIRGPMFQPPSIRPSWEHLIAHVSLYPAQGCPHT